MSELIKLITYNLAEISAMDTNQLLIQFLARKDLERPRRQATLDGVKTFREAIRKTEAFCETIHKMGIPVLEHDLRKLIAAALADVEDTSANVHEPTGVVQ